MKTKKRLVAAMLFLVTTGAKTQPLAIGDTMPHITLRNIENYSSTTLNFETLKGKWVILDFWGTGCTVCIRAFPKMDSLQQQFGDKIQVLMINDESKDSTDRFFAKRKKFHRPVSPMIMGDTLLSALFPHTFVPHHVWIDPRGKIRYITNGHNATAKNIEALLAGQQVAMNTLEDNKMFNSAKPVIAQEPAAWFEKVKYYSTLSLCISGVAVGNTTKSNYIIRNCHSIRQLLKTAFEEKKRTRFHAENTIRLYVENRESYTRPVDMQDHDAWQNNNSYNYELKVPEEQAADLYKYMQQDILRYFNLRAVIKKQWIDAWALIITGRDKLSQQENRESNVAANNESFDNFFAGLQASYNYLPRALPLVNLAANTSHFKIRKENLQVDFSDWKAAENKLAAMGLKLVRQKCLVDVLIVTEKKEQ